MCAAAATGAGGAEVWCSGRSGDFIAPREEHAVQHETPGRRRETAISVSTHAPVGTLSKYFHQHRVLHTVAYSLYRKGDYHHSFGWQSAWTHRWPGIPQRHGLTRPPLFVKWHIESGRGSRCGRRSAPPHRMPLVPEGRPVRPGPAWHMGPGPFRALDHPQVDGRHSSMRPQSVLPRARKRAESITGSNAILAQPRGMRFAC